MPPILVGPHLYKGGKSSHTSSEVSGLSADSAFFCVSASTGTNMAGGCTGRLLPEGPDGQT